MRLSVFLSYQRIGPPDAYREAPYKEKLAEARLADELGFDLVWVPEHHLIHFMQTPSASLLAAQIGLQTSIRVGTMVSLLNYRHPLINAGELALLDHVLEGRLEIGVGRGAYEYEFERLGLDFKEGKERFNESLQSLRKIWAHPEGAVDFEGEHTSFGPSYVWPMPLQDPHPPLWYAAMSEQSIEYAVAGGYHVTNWPFLSPIGRVRTVADTFHAARESEGVPRGQQMLGILRGAWVAETEADARRHVETALVNHRINQRLHHFTQRADPRGYVFPEPLDQEPTADEVYENLLMGTPAEVLDKLAAYEAAGVDEVLLMFDFGAPHEEVMQSMRLFGEQVMGPFRERAGRRSSTPVGA